MNFKNYIFLMYFLSGLVHANAELSQLKQFIDQQDFPSALMAGEQILDKKPNDSETQFLTALALQKQRMFTQAAELYQNLIEKHPDSPEPKNNLAMIYQQQGDFDEASKLLISAIDTNQSYATAYQNLNKIYSAMAREAYRLAINETSKPPNVMPELDLLALNSILLTKKIISVADNEIIEKTDMNSKIKDNQYSEEKRKQKLIDHLHSWIKAWNNHQFARYIDHYEEGYNPDSIRQQRWVGEQFQILQRNGPLQVKVKQIDFLVFKPEVASVQFEQVFILNRNHDRILKRLDMVHINGQWKIAEEEIISTL